ncbi:MAG: DUF2894 domain-containing protein [Deltaproteobacteria bacterium]|nr:DUF2894 domain-containing protein [Deltaproteobacteria bacterium]
MGEEATVTWQQAAEQFARLRDQGAASFDPPAARFIESLLARASVLSEGAQARLVARVTARVALLETAFAAAREEAQGRVETLQQAGGEDGKVTAAFFTGDYKDASRRALRALRELKRSRMPHMQAGLLRLADTARTRRTRLPQPVARDLRAMESGRPSAPPRSLSTALSWAIYRETEDELNAILLAARATENMPESVGAYNGLRLAARSMQVFAELSSPYLRTLVARLRDIAVLQRLPERKKPKTGARRSSRGKP